VREARNILKEVRLIPSPKIRFLHSFDLQEIKASVTSQPVEMSMGLRNHFDVKEVINSMANGYANARIDMPNTGGFAERVVSNAVSTLSGTAHECDLQTRS
jgi:hypothetical protein